MFPRSTWAFGSTVARVVGRPGIWKSVGLWAFISGKEFITTRMKTLRPLRNNPPSVMTSFGTPNSPANSSALVAKKIFPVAPAGNTFLTTAQSP